MGHSKEDTSPYGLDAERGPNGSRDQLIVKPIHTWKGYMWDTWELPQDQRWLLFKLDAFVLKFASVSSAFSQLHELQLTIIYQDWLFFKEHRLDERQQCLSQWHGRRSSNVRQPTCD